MKMAGLVVHFVGELRAVRNTEIRDPLRLKEGVDLNIMLSEKRFKERILELGAWASDMDDFVFVRAFPDPLPVDVPVNAGLYIGDLLYAVTDEGALRRGSIEEFTRQAVNTAIYEAGKLVVWQEREGAVIFTIVLEDLKEARRFATSLEVPVAELREVFDFE